MIVPCQWSTIRLKKAAVLQAKGKKYPQWKVPAVSVATVFRVNPA